MNGTTVEVCSGGMYMKKGVVLSGILFVVVIIAVIVLGTGKIAFTKNQTDELFEALAYSDGAVTEGIISDLEKIFLQNPEEFLNELNKQDDNIRKLVVSNFACYAIGEGEAEIRLAEAIESVSGSPYAEELIAAYHSKIWNQISYIDMVADELSEDDCLDYDSLPYKAVIYHNNGKAIKADYIASDDYLVAVFRTKIDGIPYESAYFSEHSDMSKEEVLARVAEEEPELLRKRLYQKNDDNLLAAELYD